MTYRDRLVADLHAADCKVNRLYCDGQRCEDIADRLIALGWTREPDDGDRPPLDPAVVAHDSAYMAGVIRGREIEREAEAAKAYREDTE